MKIRTNLCWNRRLTGTNKLRNCKNDENREKEEKGRERYLQLLLFFFIFFNNLAIIFSRSICKTFFYKNCVFLFILLLLLFLYIDNTWKKRSYSEMTKNRLAWTESSNPVTFFLLFFSCGNLPADKFTRRCIKIYGQPDLGET